MDGPKSKRYKQTMAAGALGTAARRELYRERLSAKVVTSTVGGVPLELEQDEVAGESVRADTAVLGCVGAGCPLEGDPVDILLTHLTA